MNLFSCPFVLTSSSRRLYCRSLINRAVNLAFEPPCYFDATVVCLPFLLEFWEEYRSLETLDTAIMSYYGYQDQGGSWSEKFSFSDYDDVYDRVYAGLDSLWIVSLVAVAIWAVVLANKKDRNVPKTARLNVFWATIVSAIV